MNPVNDKQPKLVQQSLSAGFKGGWRAAMETVAGWLEDGMRKAGEDPAEYSVCVADLVKAIRAQAEHAPTPGIVEMKSKDEPLNEQAQARAVFIPDQAPNRGAIPSAEEAFPFLAAIVANMPPGRAVRRMRAEWVALLGFALHTRDCAAADGLLEALDREAERMRDLINGTVPDVQLPKARRLGPEAKA